MDEDLATSTDAGFAGLGLRPELLRALADLGYEEPTPIQREAITPLIAGHDLVGQAATGTGKTAAFALPLLQSLEAGGSDSPTALVLVPTRELAEQVSQAVHRYGRDLNVRVLPVYGGQPISRQLHVLRRGVDVVVGTPGRILDHIERETLQLDAVRTVVLDEADEMLDMGFAEDIEAILAETPTERQTVLFSATMPPRIDAIARRHLREPLRIRMGRDTSAADALPTVRQSTYLVARAHKTAALGRILDVEMPTAAIVFCRTREEVDEVTESLNGRGYRAEALHGGLSQDQRDRVMGRLRGGSTELLVATDVAARGLDVEQLTHVINYNVPSAPEAYVHRIGRVGRAGRTGAAITLAEPREQRMLKAIERLTGQRIALEKLPTVTDLRARRLDLVRTTVQDAMSADDLDRFRSVLASLTDDADLETVALAGLKLLHEANGGDVDEQEIPAIAPMREREDRGRDSRGPGSDRFDDRRPGRGRSGSGPVTRVFVGLGRRAGLRPQDLVGAIAGEAGLPARDVGAIQITDRFSLVEVPEADAERVIRALSHSTIRGRRPTVRRDRPNH
ncbi:DEAD/DEAH box helicase [Actinoplanes regularis]|uniref:RNA helicase n=1 Tax=Actinoplanes regularis TaxID=52697 RepID=A0A239IA51_9ACTN|nr:DEAD/DEAH box helicase [Actinoplanes regularis]GIE91319.1 DEAD-box ATP-dependent RNA helicase CshA [Actinoplanes regularis]GLW34649.1 DEAD-box ATP-dependent RNA helicase CshA [Actinoplanes regularis]SNS89234.1 ATP-dependent RNA helicase DeaD [Actinoplanes regularis]